MAKQDKRTKIALVGYKLANGGLERVFSIVSELLSNSNCDIYVIVLEDEIEYPFSGTLINLGNYSKFKKYFQLRKQLKANQFDYVIDFRHRINPWMELVFLHYIYAGFKSVYTIHSSKLEVYLTGKKWIGKQILRNAYKVVSVSNDLNEKLKLDYQFEKGVVIPNSISENIDKLNCSSIELPDRYCIAVGRLVALKQFDKLIQTYSQSRLPGNAIHLVILGEGGEKVRLQKLIEKLEMSAFIHLLGFKHNANFYIKRAEFLVLSSKYEGFSMVILEALSAGIPVVSFDCETGPRELVKHEFNGLLVENQNFNKLEMAMNRIVEEEQFYLFCKENAQHSVTAYSAPNIQKKWLDLINSKII